MPVEPSEGATLDRVATAVVGARLVGSGSLRVTGVQHDSRDVSPGDLFVAVRGATHDGARFVGDALGRGASAVLAEEPLPVDVAQITVPNVRLALGLAAELVYGRPTSTLCTVGITGTNGKTTTAHLLRHAIVAGGGKPALIGTTGWHADGVERPSTHTTPEGDDISRFARRALDGGATHLVLEVSSHGLAMHRVDAIDFEVAVFTNLSRDHLDFHETMEGYGDAKTRLFTELEPRCAVIHVDDPFGAQIAERVNAPRLRCSRREEAAAEILARTWSATRSGIFAEVETPRGLVEIESPLLGEHNLENLLVALGCACALELDLEAVAHAWKTAEGTPGRLERIPHPNDVAVLVDYAHTPEALRRALQTMRAVTPKRLIVVFGAGGDRDPGKRPEMGRVGTRYADLAVLTSDNPRSEHPERILDEVEAGALDAGSAPIQRHALAGALRGHCRLVDRREAIATAIRAAQPGDTVLLAGKGHETYQIIGSDRIHFDDREEARAAIERMTGGV